MAPAPRGRFHQGGIMISRRSFLKNSSLSLAAAYVRPSLNADGVPPVLKEFSYGDVQLAPGAMQTQFEQTQAVLLQMNVDSMLKPWRLRAGLPAPGPDMGGWYDEVPPTKTPSGGQGFAPAHAFGQWVSAMARGYAVTGDAATRAKVQHILELYTLAVSGRFYTNFRYPAYNYDKTVCGLIDAHSYCDLDRDFALLNRVSDVAVPHLPPHALDRDQPQRQWRQSIGENTTDDYTWDESYTMPENLYLAWQRGAGERYRGLAQRFLLDETYFDPLAAGKNVLAGHHAYSYCNALSSAMQAYLSTGSEKHLAAGRNAFAMIDTTQSFATGGWGPDESFRAPESDDMFQSLNKTHSGFETPCGSYAHFKLTRYLLRVTRGGRYGDSMERVLYNTVLGAKPLENDGHAFYYSDYNYQGAKSYFPDRWPCCSGTLPQVAADYHILIYFRDPSGIYVNLYLPSTLKWTAENGAQFTLTQSGDYPREGNIRLDLRANRSANFNLRLRIPAWAQQQEGSAPTIRVNDAPVRISTNAGFVALERTWKDGDRLELSLPMPLRLQPIDSRHPGTVALMRGPLVLFALAENPSVKREQLLAAQRADHDIWTCGAVRFSPFTAIDRERYSTYVTLI
jgi:DUF1680 family protein